MADRDLCVFSMAVERMLLALETMSAKEAKNRVGLRRKTPRLSCHNYGVIEGLQCGTKW